MDAWAWAVRGLLGSLEMELQGVVSRPTQALATELRTCGDQGLGHLSSPYFAILKTALKDRTEHSKVKIVNFGVYNK